MVKNIERNVHHRFARSAENIAIVSESVAEDPKVLIPRRSQELGQSYGTLRRILQLDLYLHLFKVQFMQQLKPADHPQYRRYVGLEQQTVDGNFSNQIFFSEEVRLISHYNPSVGIIDLVSHTTYVVCVNFKCK